MDGNHGKSVAPAGGEDVALRHPAKPVDDQQGRPVVHGIDGVCKTDGKHVVTVRSPEFHRDAPKDTRVALKPLAKDFLSHHVAHGTHRKAE